MQTLGAFEQKPRRFLQLHERFEPILVAEREDHAAEDLNNCAQQLLQHGLEHLRAVFDEHRVAFQEHRGASNEHRVAFHEHGGGVVPVDAPSVAYFAREVVITLPPDAILAAVDPKEAAPGPHRPGARRADRRRQALGRPLAGSRGGDHLVRTALRAAGRRWSPRRCLG